VKLARLDGHHLVSIGGCRKREIDLGGHGRLQGLDGRIEKHEGL
jgi:hypothetical protein